MPVKCKVWQSLKSGIAQLRVGAGDSGLWLRPRETSQSQCWGCHTTTTSSITTHASLILLPQGYVLLRRCARNPEERQQLCVWIDPQGSQIFEGRRITKHYIRLCLKTNLNIMCLSLKHARYIQMRKMRDPNMYTRRQDSGWSKIINVMCFFMSQK